MLSKGMNNFSMQGKHGLQLDRVVLLGRTFKSIAVISCFKPDDLVEKEFRMWRAGSVHFARKPISWA